LHLLSLNKCPATAARSTARVAPGIALSRAREISVGLCRGYTVLWRGRLFQCSRSSCDR
jgi:hypothetical protein